MKRNLSIYKDKKVIKVLRKFLEWKPDKDGSIGCPFEKDPIVSKKYRDVRDKKALCRLCHDGFEDQRIIRTTKKGVVFRECPCNILPLDIVKVRVKQIVDQYERDGLIEEIYDLR